MIRPILQSCGSTVIYRDKRVGVHAREMSGAKVFVAWKVFHRVKDSYSMTVELFDQIDDDVRFIYVIDKNTRDVYKYDIDTYLEADTTEMNGQEQYIPWFKNHVGKWENYAEKLIPSRKIS